MENRICPHCQGSDIVTGVGTSTYVTFTAPALFGTKSNNGEPIVADLCKTCGTLIRLFVRDADHEWSPNHFSLTE
jgi:hypothetical protein